MWPWNLTDDLKQGKSEGFDSWDRPSNLKLDSNLQFFHLCDHEIWWITSKNNRALLLYYIKLSLQIHWWIQTDGWPWKTIVHLFYTTPSFVHHFKAMGEVKPELPSGNAQVRSKLVIFLSRLTLKFDTWKTIGHLFYTTLSFVHHFKAMSEFKLELQSGNAQFGSKLMIFRAVRP